jgi:hypothetical protein
MTGNGAPPFATDRERYYRRGKFGFSTFLDVHIAFAVMPSEQPRGQYCNVSDSGAYGRIFVCWLVRGKTPSSRIRTIEYFIHPA